MKGEMRENRKYWNKKFIKLIEGYYKYFTIKNIFGFLFF